MINVKQIIITITLISEELSYSLDRVGMVQPILKAIQWGDKNSSHPSPWEPNWENGIGQRGGEKKNPEEGEEEEGEAVNKTEENRGTVFALHDEEDMNRDNSIHFTGMKSTPNFIVFK